MRREKFSRVNRLVGLALLVGAVLGAPGGGAARQARGKTHEVTCKDMEFLVGGKKQDLKIKAGDSVVWVNKDEEDHTATSDKGSKFKFDVKVPVGKKSKAVKFTTKGTFKYHCKPHPDMKGTIIVE